MCKAGWGCALSAGLCQLLPIYSHVTRPGHARAALRYTVLSLGFGASKLMPSFAQLSYTADIVIRLLAVAIRQSSSESWRFGQACLDVLRLSRHYGPRRSCEIVMSAFELGGPTYDDTCTGWRALGRLLALPVDRQRPGKGRHGNRDERDQLLRNVQQTLATKERVRHCAVSDLTRSLVSSCDSRLIQGSRHFRCGSAEQFVCMFRNVAKSWRSYRTTSRGNGQRSSRCGPTSAK